MTDDAVSAAYERLLSRCGDEANDEVLRMFKVGDVRLLLSTTPRAAESVEQREAVARAVIAEVQRQCSIGAGDAAICPDTGLLQMHIDLDLYGGFVGAMIAILASLAPTSGEVAPKPEASALREAGLRFLQLKRSIMIDVGSCHANRGPGASSEMRSDDRDMRDDIDEAYSMLEAALADNHPASLAGRGDADNG